MYGKWILILRRFPVIIYCLLALLITWGLKYLYGTVVWHSGKPAFNFSLIASWGPSLAALFLTGLTEGEAGFRKTWQRLIQWRVGARWLLVAALFEPVLFGIITVSYVLRFGGSPEHVGGSILFSGIGPLIITFLLGLVRWGVAEEIGWRGWMFPHLMNRMSPFNATLVLACMTSLWHIHPNSLGSLLTVQEGSVLIGRYPEIVERLIITVPIDLVMTYIFLRTKGSLLPMVMYHSASNTAYFWVDEYFGIVGSEFFRTGFLIAVIVIFAVFAILVGRLKKGTPSVQKEPN